LKVGETQAPEIFLGSCPSTFLAVKVQLVVLVSAFVVVSTVWPVSGLLIFYPRCPLCPAICKSVPYGVGATGFV